ncbi:MAG: hypothetical protein HY689_05685 [Chloroflexi bacterium]|nr:hypothetical protein [Chloroflexota bacterium]
MVVALGDFKEMRGLAGLLRPDLAGSNRPWRSGTRARGKGTLRQDGAAPVGI